MQELSRFGKSQHGYIGLVILFVAAVLILALWPKLPLTQESGPPPTLSNNCPTIPSIADAIKIPDMPAIEKSGAGTATFIQVRGNIPIDRNYYIGNGRAGSRNEKHYVLKVANKVLSNGKTYDVYYPKEFAGAGEIDYPKGIVSKYRHPGQKRTSLYFPDFKIIFLVEKDATGNPIETDGTDDHGKKATFWLSDLFEQESELLTNPLPTDALTCQTQAAGQSKASGASIVFPTQQQSKDKKQLQLEWFIPQQTYSGPVSGWSTHCKPAIYLYPQEKTEVNVQVNTKGILTYVDPPYPLSGWETTAYPDGTLFVNNKKYDYLYYESKIPDNLIQKPEEGFVASYEQLSQLYATILPKLGLNQQQTNDFIEYWEKALPKSPYYFVGLLKEENLTMMEPLFINPKPQTIIRVRLYFEGLVTPKIVKEPSIVMPQKKGFTVVEWGGMIKRDKDHPFTCSQ